MIVPPGLPLGQYIAVHPPGAIDGTEHVAIHTPAGAVQASIATLTHVSVGFSVPELDDLRDRAGVFSAVSAVYQGPANLTGGEHPERLESGVVSPNYFSILGARPQLGRLFDPGDTAPGFADAVVISVRRADRCAARVRSAAL